jgi:hypothetical protein
MSAAQSGLYAPTTRPRKNTPGNSSANDRFNKRMKANILKGCAPGGFYDQLDEATRQVRAKCANLAT